MKKLRTLLLLAALALPMFAQDVIDPSCCTLDQAQKNQLQSTQIMVANQNANLTKIYLGKFNDWKISVDAGRIPNTNPPKPPVGYVVSKPDANGFQWPVLGSSPVVEMPAIPEDHSVSQSTRSEERRVGKECRS